MVNLRRTGAVAGSLLVVSAMLVVALMVASNATPASAATITVDSFADVIADDGVCTLREAITAANTDTASGATLGECAAGSGADTIDLPAGTYTLSIAGASEEANATGDLDITSVVTINGAGAATTIIDANGIDRVFDVRPSSEFTLEISGVTIQGGGNVPPNSVGGGIRVWFGALTLTDSTVSGNVAASLGGGIYNQSGDLTIIRSTISGNTAGTEGGGIAVVSRDATLALTNSTVSGNTANGNGGGGILFQLRDAGSATLTNSTISDNTGLLGAGIRDVTQGEIFVTLTNTIIAQNIGLDNCRPAFWTSGGHNLSSDSTCSFTATGDLQNTDPLLGPLADNGGPTQTHALLSGSPAIDAGDDAACPATDQRGVARPQGTQCDIGAYEVEVAATPTPTPTPPPASTATPTPTPTALAATPTPTPTPEVLEEVQAPIALPDTGGEPAVGGSSVLPWLAAIVGGVALLGSGGAWLAYQRRRVR